MPELSALLADLTSGDDVRAESAVAVLATLGETAQAEVLALAGSGDADHRWWGLRALAQFENPPLAPFFWALEDELVEIRQCAALGLSYHAAPDAIPALIKALGDGDSMVVYLAGNALSAVGAEAVPELIEVLEKGTRGARLEATRTLAAIKDPRAIPALMKVMQEDSAIMQYWAVEGLDKLGLGMIYLKPD